MSDFELTVTIPADVAQRIAAAVCYRWGYDPLSGMDPVAFTQHTILQWLGDQAISHEAELAADVARNTVRGNADDPLVAWLASRVPAAGPEPEPPLEQA